VAVLKFVVCRFFKIKLRDIGNKKTKYKGGKMRPPIKPKKKY
jgi:hypothetical protein